MWMPSPPLGFIRDARTDVGCKARKKKGHEAVKERERREAEGREENQTRITKVSFFFCDAAVASWGGGEVADESTGTKIFGAVWIMVEGGCGRAR